jgi:hypothetical protein
MSAMRWLVLVLAAGVACLLARPATTAGSQQRDEDTVKIYGLGTAPCRTWLEVHDAVKTGQADPRQAQFESWIYGYATAYSIFARSGSRNVLRTDTGEIRSFLDSYCREHPDEIFQTATTELIKDQLKR